MNRYNILTIIIVFISILYMGSEANACVNELPIPVIANSYYQYSVVGNTVYFDGGDSYDPDDGTSPGDGITQWWWNVYDESLNCIQVGLSGENTNYTFTQPGIYTVALWVKGDDGDDDWTPEPYAYADKCLVYVSAVTQPFWWHNGSYWEMTSGPVYVPVTQSIYICANGNPNTGSPDYYNYFPAGTPSWSISPTGPAISEYSSGYCYGGSYSDKVLVYSFPSPGTYTLTATAGTSSQSIDIVAFSATLSLASPFDEAVDGQTFNVDLNINPSSVESVISSVDFDIEPMATNYGNVAGSLSTMSQRDSDQTHWQVDTALWYDTSGADCPDNYAGYEISAEFNIGSQTYSSSTGYLCVWDCDCYDFCCGVAWPYNFWTGNIQITTEQLSANLWEATINMNTFARNVQADYAVYNPANSQFYDMILAEETYHVEQMEDATGSTTDGYFVGLWQPIYIVADIWLLEPFQGSTEQAAIDAAQDAFDAAVEAEEDRSDAVCSSSAFYCDVEEEAKDEADSEYTLTLGCAYPECN